MTIKDTTDDDRSDALGGACSQTGCKLISRRSALRQGAMVLGVFAMPTLGHVAPSILRVSSLRFDL